MDKKSPITAVKGPCIILAGAGTGKTYTIVEKIKYLLHNQLYRPENVVCLTFSNEAVNNLRSRVLPSTKDGEPIIRTFHSFCSDILKEHGNLIGINDKFRILLPDDAKIMLHKYFKTHPRLCMHYIDTIGKVKDIGITLKDYTDYLERKKKENPSDIEKELEKLQFSLQTLYLKKEASEKKALKEQVTRLGNIVQIKKFVQAWTAYEKMKEKKNFLDYSDLNIKTLQLLSRFHHLAEPYKYVIVDEFQDTNKMQLDLLMMLAPHRNITIVGDLNQSIYRFRGSYKNNFTFFKEWSGATQDNLYALEKSYRSPNNVLKIAHTLIGHNYENKEECFEVMNAYKREGVPIEVYEMLDEKEEVRAIVDYIQKTHTQGRAYEDICIMFRTHQQARRLKKELERFQIPFVSVSRRSLLSISYMKKILNYITIANKISSNEKGGEYSWWELIYESFSKEDLTILGKTIKKNTASGSELYSQLSSLELSKEGKIKRDNIMKHLTLIQAQLKKPIEELIKEVSSLVLPLEEDLKKAKEMLLNANRLAEIAKEYAEHEGNDIGQFLYHLEIMQKLGIELDSVALEEKGVRIMTHHSTKGLEYPFVICASMVQGKFPSEYIKHDSLLPSELKPELATLLTSIPEYLHEQVIEDYERDSQLKEERRLCYVAFTRTKEKLVITYAREYNARSYKPSQFLEEIKYTENPLITFIKDEDKKYQEPEAVLVDALTLDTKKPKRYFFSPSALLLFNDCQKKYEYKYVLHMPEKAPISWEEINLGSFVHKIIEEGVKNAFSSEKAFLDRARVLYTEEEWKSINLDDALGLLRVFYERNKHKYSSASLTEVKLRTRIDGLDFEGYADRIDIHPQGLEIIDYKTGRSLVPAQHRNWQLGLYALAAQDLGLGNVKRLTLDMLRHEKPLEFELRDNIAYDINAVRTSFNLNTVKEELVASAKKIIACYEKGFKACPPEKNCEFCNEWAYTK